MIPKNFNNAPNTNYHRNNGGYSQDPTPEWITKDFNNEWITEGVDRKFIEYAEKAGKELAVNKLTTSKIRNIYGEVKRIQMGDFENLKTSFYLLKPKVAYAVGREKDNKGLKYFKEIFDKCYPLVKDKKTFENFCDIFEAILAYHRAYGGKD